MGTNPDLVVMARTDAVERGDVFRTIYDGAFEHFAKERCLLPASVFPRYAAQARLRPTWRMTNKLKRLDPSTLDAVLAEVDAIGPCTANELSDHGQVNPIDWGGWKSTSRATSMALEVLALQCRVVVSGRTGRLKSYDIPSRALGPLAPIQDDDEFDKWALKERVQAAALLGCRSGPCWSTLGDARKAHVDPLICEGALEEVRLEGSPTRFLTTPGAPESTHAVDDDELRILGPLDPLLWDRRLLYEAFDFEYVWEVYKPAAIRRFAWYVMPLLHEGVFVGRLAGRVEGSCLVVEHLWREAAYLDMRALDRTLADHAARCGCTTFTRPLQASRNPS